MAKIVIECDNSDCQADEKTKKKCKKQMPINNGNGRSRWQKCLFHRLARVKVRFNQRTKQLESTKWRNQSN